MIKEFQKTEVINESLSFKCYLCLTLQGQNKNYCTICCFQIWDAVSGSELHSFSHRHIVKSVNFSQDNSSLVTGSNEKLIRIWDLNKPEMGKD